MLRSPLTCSVDTVVIHVADASEDGNCVVEEATMTQCIEDVHKVFAAGDLQPALLRHLHPVLPLLAQIYCFSSATVSGIK